MGAVARVGLGGSFPRTRYISRTGAALAARESGRFELRGDCLDSADRPEELRLGVFVPPESRQHPAEGRATYPDLPGSLELLLGHSDRFFEQRPAFHEMTARGEDFTFKPKRPRLMLTRACLTRHSKRLYGVFPSVFVRAGRRRQCAAGVKKRDVPSPTCKDIALQERSCSQEIFLSAIVLSTFEVH